ncbi:zinc transport system ATP-binding protein [Oceanicella actignis]|uniref:Zinc transport system ATP-binding protein n=1 Tax=Oceanicella actignis TaxID=1189325 RepID=A0A1M7S0I7_9RHOB|nr:zinc transport system ATP-binding protein [Oceanicella actignis]SHN51968.1 zinc transport system ATP-binding protein [Oceanicella actignis]
MTAPRSAAPSAPVNAPGRQPAAARESAPLIAARGVCVRIEGRTVLRDVDLEIRPAEIVTILGPNGSGKTTLLRALIGALTPDAGEIRRSPDLCVGHVPQRLSLDRTMPLTVDRFLALSGARRAARQQALERVGIGGRAGAMMAALSGGQFQRALLAHALLRRPNLFVLDEPTQGLDQPGVAAFYRLIEDLRRETGAAVLMVSHDLHVVMSASDRVICLNGHVCCSGAPHVVARAPEYRALFGLGTQGALALYRHEHDHSHAHDGPAPAREEAPRE